MISPSRICRRRGKPLAIFSSWVIRTRVAPSAASSCRSASTPSPARESRLPVGSSASTIVGRLATARAIATRWRSPPDSCRGLELEPVAEADAFERDPGGLPPLAQRHPGVKHAVGDVVDRGHRLLQVKCLEHEPDPVRAQPRKFAVAGFADVLPGDLHLTSGGTLERPQDAQHRRLARPRWSDDGDLVAVGNLHSDVPQSGHAARVLLDDVVER